jgi:hypothetical protein
MSPLHEGLLANGSSIAAPATPSSMFALPTVSVRRLEAGEHRVVADVPGSEVGLQQLSGGGDHKVHDAEARVTTPILPGQLSRSAADWLVNGYPP